MINYTELKAAMTQLGYQMSSGTGWTASDDTAYRSYLYLHQNNLTPYLGKMGMAYTGILPEGFPGTSTKTLVSLAISGYDAPLLIGVPQQLVATGTYDDESTEDVTSSVNWGTADELVATVEGGLLTGVAEGEVEISAELGEVQATPISVTVEAAPELVSIAVTGYTDPLAPEGTVQLTATGTYDDESTEDVTATATWESSDELVAVVDAGLVTGVANGSADITASVGDITSPAVAVTVETAAPELVNVVIELPSSTMVAGTNQDMVARAHYDDESTEDVTAQVTAWYSSDPGVAAFADPSVGIVDAIAAGTTNITCDVLGITSDAAVLTVTEE